MNSTELVVGIMLISQNTHTHTHKKLYLINIKKKLLFNLLSDRRPAEPADDLL